MSSLERLLRISDVALVVFRASSELSSHLHSDAPLLRIRSLKEQKRHTVTLC